MGALENKGDDRQKRQKWRGQEAGMSSGVVWYNLSAMQERVGV